VDQDIVGVRNELRERVTSELSAEAFGNRGLQTLATPALVGLIERAAMVALEPFLEQGERSVGSSIQLDHLAPTPLGAEVAVQVEVVELDGSKVSFAVEARDEQETIARGRHGRVVVDAGRFDRLVARKAR